MIIERASFEDAYIASLKEFIKLDHVPTDKDYIDILGMTISLVNPRARMVFNQKRGCNYEFAMKMAIWIINGHSDADYLVSSNKHAAEFKEESSKEFMTAYGPRFVKQLDNVLQELRDDAHSRRATVLILESEDQKWLGQRTVEYPCTLGFTFYLRDGCLDMVVNMRSNNMVTTICYDVFVFTMIQELVASKLSKIRDERILLGRYIHQIQNAHVFRKDIDFAKEIIECDSQTLVRVN